MKRFTIIVVFFSTLFTTAYAQNRLQLADTIRDETDMLRYFKISKKEPAKRLADAENVLQSVFTPDKSIAFKLVKTKTGSDNTQSLLYQQTYNGVPVYDSYYYLHFMNNIFTEANGEYAAIKKVINAINLKKTDAINSAIKHISSDKSIQPSSADGELTLWRSNREEDYRYVYKVEVNYPDAQKSRECMIDAATGEVLIAVPVVCYTNVTCSGTTVYSGTRNFTGDSFAGGVRLRETRNGLSIRTMDNQNNVNVNAVDFVNATTTWTSAGINEGALDVHLGVERFLDYFSTVFSRNSIDGSGHTITCYTNRWEPAGLTTQPMDNGRRNNG